MRARTAAAPPLEVGPREGAQLPVVLAGESCDAGAPGWPASIEGGAQVLAVPLWTPAATGVGIDDGDTGAGATDGSAGAHAGAGPLGAPQRSAAAEAGVAYGIDVALAAEQAGFTGAAGSTLALPGAAPTALAPGGTPARLLLLGLGRGSALDARRAGAALARAVRGRTGVATSAMADAGSEVVTAFVEGFLLASWRSPRSSRVTGAAAGDSSPPALLLPGCSAGAAVQRAITSARATWRVRDLVTTPSSTKTPAWVAGQAQAMAASLPGLAVEVLEPAQLARQGYGGLLAVGAGSASPPVLVRATWTPPAAASSGRHIVLVGKGITFDTGGLALKPRESMVAMKNDMAGAAVVLAALLGAAELGLPHRVTALVPLAENSLGASSYRPGDVITLHGGTSVEVANPDAEGRLVLADALHAADADLDPDVIIDVATLTGAAPTALGKRHAALFSGDDALAAELAAAAEHTGERVWRMPLVEDYRSSLDSPVADLCHVPHTSPGAGAITAALFLREFVGGRRWAHLDIAGPTTSGSDEHEVAKGATGYGARLLLRWMEAAS